jgi:regulator of replication initiation timing
VDKFNQSTDKRMNLVTDEDGLDMIVIFPGKTNYRENALYKQIAIAKTTSNPSYWSWQMAEAQVKKDDVVMADTPTSVVAPSPATLTVVPVADSTMVAVADSTMVAVETSTSMTTPAGDLESRLELHLENELVHMENDDLNRRFAVLNAEHTTAVENLKTAQLKAKDRDAEYATLSAEFEQVKGYLESLVHDDATGGYKDCAVKEASVWKVLKEKTALRTELDKAFEDLAEMQTMRNDSVECCKTLREKVV